MKEYREEDYPPKTTWQIIKVILQVILIFAANVALIAWGVSDHR